MFWKRKHKVEATELAQSLLNEFVHKIVVYAPDDLCLDAIMTARYEIKAKLYQLAAVLMALMVEEGKNAGFLPVREHLEADIFPSSPDVAGSLLAEVKTAMQDLNDLFAPGQRKQMSWARAWLNEIGVDETNPATLTLYACHWMDYYTMVVKSLGEFNPKVQHQK